MSHAEKQENNAARLCVFTLVKARGQYTKHCHRDANLLHLVAASVVREVPQCRCSAWKRALSVSTPGAETQLLMILDVSFFYMAAAEPRLSDLSGHYGCKGTEGEKCSCQNLKAHNAKISCQNLQQLWVVEQTASEKAASRCRTKKTPITFCCSKKMTAQSWRRAKRACEISVRSCHLKPFHVNCVSSKCCSTNWAVNMELWTLASECSRSRGAHRRALPPSFAAHVYTSLLDARPPRSEGAVHGRGRTLCSAVPSTLNKIFKNSFKTIEKEALTRGRQVFIGAQLYFGARSASASIAASLAPMGAHGVSPTWLRGEEMPQGVHICC